MPSPTRNLLPALLLSLLLVPSILAQLAHEGPAKAIERAKTVQPFDVISIRQNNSGTGNGYWNIDDHGLYTATNVPLETVIEFAYDIKSDQIVGLTGPVSSARFDVAAKVLPSGEGKPPDLPDANLQAMTILLLEDRFHLKALLQPKIMPVYDLVAARGGLKIKLSPDELKDNSWNINRQDTSIVLTSKGLFMSDLAAALSDQVHRQVIDKTGLPGHADITLKWSDDVAMQQGGPDAISIFTAVEEQLGLKLQPSKGPVDTLVIDHVEMPTEN